MTTISRVNIFMIWICGSFLLIFEDTWKIIGIDQCKVLYILYALLILKLTILQIKMRKAALTISDDDLQTNERFQTFTSLVNGILILLICSMLANSIRIRKEEINYLWPLEMISHTIIFNGYILIMAWLYSPVYIFE